MTEAPLEPPEAAAELLRRRRARDSLVAFANAIDVPGKPAGDGADEWLFQPVETSLARHHLLLLETLEALGEGRLFDRDKKTVRNCMVFMPPGSAKSTYGSVVFPTWFMGRHAGSRVILTSYASDIARKQGRRARQIVRSGKYESIFGTGLSAKAAAAEEWALENGSEFMAGGILSGVTGNRAHGLIIDDPVKGREEADSALVRAKTRAAYEDDLITRLVPGAWTLLVQTRWHEDDLAGSILPAAWAGESGDIVCRDGQVWRVVSIPAVAEENDVLERAPGELLWPEWFTPEHFARYRGNHRTWSALSQQRPSPEEGDFFRREWIHEADNLPALATLKVYMASDYAVTAGGGDFSVHVVVGIDPAGKMWLIDLWRQQAASDEWVESWCDLVLRYRPAQAAEETGQINAGIGPFLTKRARERGAYTYRRTFPAKGDKAVPAQSIRGRMAMDGLMVPAGAPWLSEFVSELLAFPAGRHDDQVDALGLIGQLLDAVSNGREPRDEPIKPKVLEYVGQPGGTIKGNMSVRDVIEARVRRNRVRGRG